MATKAELEAELERLRTELADRDSVDASEGKTGDESETPVDRFLADRGLSVEDFEGLLEQLSEELGKLPQNKPVLTALGAFALGFLAGRMTK